MSKHALLSLLICMLQQHFDLTSVINKPFLKDGLSAHFHFLAHSPELVCDSAITIPAMFECLPQFLLHQSSSSPTVVGLQPAKLLVAAIVLLNEHSSPPALLELLLFVVAAKFTLDKDGGLRHLLIKCILPMRAE